MCDLRLNALGMDMWMIFVMLQPKFVHLFLVENIQLQFGNSNIYVDLIFGKKLLSYVYEVTRVKK